MAQKKLFLLDAYALIFRAYYAFITNPIKNSRGFNTSTIFGFINTLDEVLRKEDPSHIAVVFDPAGPTFRNELYPEYKANREETPEDIRASLPWVKKIIEAYNIPVVESPGYEADDVIGTLAKKAEKEGYTVFLMTPDKDFAQLVSDNIFMYKPKRSGNEAEVLGVEEVKERFGVDDPLQVIDILALWGDSSDNVPGIPGIGEKTSKKLISQYKSLETILENVEQFKGKQKQNILNSRDQAIVSKQLVTIKLDAPVEFDADRYEKKDFNKEKLTALFDELEFRTLKTRIIGKEEAEKVAESGKQGDLFEGFSEMEKAAETNMDTLDTVKKEYILLDSVDKANELKKQIYKSKVVCFDTETTGLDPYLSELLGISLAYEKDKAYYYSHNTNINRDIFNILKEIIENNEILKIGQNLKYDIRVLKEYDIHCKGELFDTMVAHYLLQPEQRHNLNMLSEHYLNYSPVKIESLIGPKGKKQKTLAGIPLEKLIDYACEDADVTMQLYEILNEKLKENNLEKLAGEVEMPLVYVLADMEHAGVKLDTQTLKDYALFLNKEMKDIEKKIYDLAGLEFNISSPRQLGEVLFDRLKISPDAKRTKTKQYSTSEDVLTSLVERHEIVPAVLEFRSVKKLLSTYVEALPKLINPKTERVHTSFNQTLVATGRLSSNNPNLQNIPIREERGREIRKSFVAGATENILVAADYSQIELRLMAHLSSDQNMITAFNNNEDIHTATAARIHGIPEEQVTREMRSEAKTANFGIIYGISAFGLAQRLKIKRTEAKSLIEGYFKSFPGVKKYMDESIAKAREDSCVYTLMGRKRYLPDIQSRNSMVRGIAERNAINAPIQGSAADIIKIAMVKIHKRIQEEGLNSQMILQVHDELIFDVLPGEEKTMIALIREEMEDAWKLDVPLTVEVGKGKNWFEAH